ncbi:MAG: NAD(P)/FAD-dependent oxidoreductase [Acidobacteria bacterium]|nr:NAD(P)/FAD-dependent oxidoreductase [Acidobacteriota bacterium]
MASGEYDGVVIGSGPNGLSAAITLARAGWKVLVIEEQGTIGGGARSTELTLPGFIHDVCSAVHPLAISSPFFRTLPLSEYGLEWIYPPYPVAHPFDDGTAAVLQRSVERTAESLGADRAAYLDLMQGPVADWDDLSRVLLGKPQLPEYPLKLARFAMHAVRSISRLAYSHFQTERARALFAGIAAHSNLSFDRRPSAGFGLVLGAAGHAVGWPVPRGGSQRIADALSAYLRSLGGSIITGTSVRSLSDIPPARAVLCDVTPRQLLRIAGDRLPSAYRNGLARYRYAPGAFKLDWALRGPIPWTASECLNASTVHVGGSMEEMAESERATWSGRIPERPVMIVTQSSLFDSSRAPAGRHTGWAYCHVPNGCIVDMTERMEAQIERFAPGFRGQIMARHVFSPAKLEQHNANLIGGDFMGGVQDLRQLLFRPTRHWYSAQVKGLYLCSSSTPPGGGVHGMCGFFAAEAALRECA